MDPHVATTPDRPFQLVGGALCLDLVNTLGNWHDPARRHEYLSSYHALLRWAKQSGALSAAETAALARTAVKQPAAAAAVLARALELRRVVRAVVLAASHRLPPAAADLAALNGFVAELLSTTRLVAPGHDTRYQLARQDDPTALDRVLWPPVHSAVDLLTTADPARLRECAGDACGWLFLDVSRGGRRRWCDMSDCGNAAKARRFRARHQAPQPRPEA